jgi:hypothetical protein
MLAHDHWSHALRCHRADQRLPGGRIRRLLVPAALLTVAALAGARADGLPETTQTCGNGHFYENESGRAAIVTVQVFNGCTGLAETIEINLFAPGVSATVTEVRERETRATSIRVPKDGVIQVRGPGGNGEFTSSFSVVVK